MHIYSVIFLAADTVRSRAYAQALQNAGITLDAGMIVRSSKKPRWGQLEKTPYMHDSTQGIFYPDISIPLERSMTEVCAQLTSIDTSTLNAQKVIDWLRQLEPSLVIFSGFGGEIISEEILQCGAPLLHLHAGYLPDYRGSTTFYYSYLNEGLFGVSAIYLRENIDMGPIIARQHYPPPPPGVDIDYIYDSAIRADLLVKVMCKYSKDGDFGDITYQNEDDGVTYYIVHPVLKHIAIQKLQN